MYDEFDKLSDKDKEKCKVDSGGCNPIVKG